jgi:hypothetical protein
MMTRRDLVRRVRAARWVKIRTPPPALPPVWSKEAVLTRLREWLSMLAASRRTVLGLELVSSGTKARLLAENEAEQARAGGQPDARVRGVHTLT